ncbi:MAG: hypothetical protein OXH13_07225 [Chloroflexi bacterium]|nr:hypothetical protein [Chloroflexota bacterium]
MSVQTSPAAPSPTVAFAGWSGSAGGSYAVTVSWPAVAGASANGYEDTFDVSPGEVEAAREGGGTASRFECQGETQRTGRTRKYCNLEPSGMYEVSVTASATRADNKVVTSEAGTAVACLGPCGLRVSGLTTSGLRLDWEGLRPGVLIHNVRLRQGGRVVQESATPRRGFNFSGLSLQPETSYRAEVRTLYRGQTAYTPWAGLELTTPEAPPPEPLALTVTPSAASCLTGETVEISWSVEGGSGRYTVSLDGAEQADASAEVVCQGTAGTQMVSLVATDTVHTTLSATQQVTLTVSAPKVAAPAGLSVAAEVTALTLGWQAVSGATAYGVRIDSGAEASLEATKTSHEFSGLEPSTKHQLSVRAYIGTDHSLWANIEEMTLAPPALVLTATATPTSCETNGEVSVSWTVTGGSGSHTVSVDGTAQSGSAVQVTCQAEAGTQNVTVLATDATYRQLTATTTLSLSVTKPAPPATVEAQVRARRLSDNRVEFGLRLGGGSDLTTAKRYLKLPEVTAGRWYASGAYTATVAGVDYTLGVVSARLDNTVCPARVEVTFIPTGGERITPERYQFEVDREADLWAATSEFAVPLKPAADSVRVQADSGAVMTEAPAGAADGPGREGGLMFGDPEPGVDSVQAEGAETVCTAQPTGLVTSAITSSGARLAWGKVTGASEYDAAAGEGEPEALDAAQLVHDFTGLAADMDHTLRVRARSWRGSSKWSASVVRTKPSPVPVLTITAGTSPITEGQSASFTITSDRTTIAALTVKLSVTESGDVTSGAAPSEATIAAGARTAAVAVATEDDEEEESSSVVTATLLAGSGYRLGSVSSASVTVTDDDGQVTPLTLTASTSPASCETGGEVTVSWSVTGGSGTHAVTVDGAAQTGASTTVTCQATAGTQRITVTATDTVHSQLTATETPTVTVVEPFTLTASVSPASCETGGEVTVSWSVTGGSGTHAVTVDGAAQTGASTKVTCQATAGTQSVRVTATDSVHTQLSATQTLSLTVTKPPPGTVEAQIRARRLSDNRVELTLKLANGTILEPAKRFATPPKLTDLAWKQSEQLSAEVGGTSYPLGTISVRLQNDRCPSRVEVSFLPASGERISPAQRFLRTNVKVDSWYLTAKFTITLSDGGSDAARGSTDGEPPAAVVWLDDTADATGAGPGTEAGLMEGEQPGEAASAERALSGQSEAATNCPAAPGGLATSGLSASQVTLSWGAVTGASQYDVRRDGGAASKASGTAHTFTGLAADTAYQLEVRARDAWGASGWSTYSETTWPLKPAQPSGLQVTATTGSLTLTWGAASRATGYEVRIGGRTVKSYGGAARSHRFAGLSADTEYTLGVRATNRGGASGWATLTRKTKPTPLSLKASVAPGSCEPGDAVTVSWTVTGGSGSYTVTVDGVAQTGSSAKVTCQQAAGRQTIAVAASDTLHTSLRASQSLPVTVASPPTVSGQVAARLLSSGKIEFAFRPQGGSRILPTGRIYTPDTKKLNVWTPSSAVYGAAGGESNRLLGKISVRHVKTTSSYYVDVCFLAAGAGARVCPAQNNFYYLTATVDRWLYTGSFSFSPKRVAASLSDALTRDGASQADAMQGAAPGEGEAAGSEGGLMSDEE